MKKIILTLIFLPFMVKAQTSIVRTLAGTSVPGYGGDGYPASVALLGMGMDIAIDTTGNLVFADYGNGRVRKIDVTGGMSLYAGNGSISCLGPGVGSPATSANVNRPAGIASDRAGNIYFADNGSHIVRRVDAGGILQALAGACAIPGFSGDLGPAAVARLNTPSDVAVDMYGNVYIADNGNNRIRKVDTNGMIKTIAGNGSPVHSGDGLRALVAGINHPNKLAIDRVGNIYFSDGGNRVRKIGVTGIIRTICGTGTAGFSGDGGPATAAKINRADGIAFDDAGNIYIADRQNNRIRVIYPNGFINTVGGTGSGAYSTDGAPATSVSIASPYGLCTDKLGNVFFNSAYRVREILFNTSAPAFVSGHSQSITICDTNTTTIDGALIVNDGDMGQTLTWNVIQSPAHGVLNGEYAIGSTGAVIGPEGLTYRADTAYAGTDTFTIAVNDGHACDTTTFYVTVIRYPHAGPLTGASFVCEGSSITIGVTDTGGIWTHVTGNTTVSSGLVTGIMPGSDTLTYTVSNFCGIDSVSDTITISPLPHAGSITGLAVICPGITDTLTDTTTTGTWAASNGYATITGIGGGALITGVAPGMDTISYTVTNTCGTDIATWITTVNPLPDAGVITGVLTICPGSSDTLTDTATGGTWLTTNSNATVFPVAGGSIISGVTAGMDTVIYSVTNYCGTATTSATITINPLPNAGTITGILTVCPGSTDTLSNTAGGGILAFSNSHASVFTAIGGCVVTGATAGLDTLTYTVSNYCGTDIATRVITVNPLPDAGTISGPAVLCEAATISLVDTVSGGIWSVTNSNATVSVAAGGCTITGVSAGIDTVIHTYTNYCGTDVVSRIITVNPLPHAGTITGAAAICPGITDTLFASTGGGVWSATGSHSAIYGSGASSVITGLSAGIDTIVHLVINSCGFDTATHIVTINPLPFAGTISGPGAVCPASTITLTASSSGGSWIAANPNATVDASGAVTGVNTGADTIVYAVTNSCGTATTTHNLTISPLPDAGVIGGTTAICPGITDTLTTTVIGGIWSASSGHVAIYGIAGGSVITALTEGTDTITHLVINSCGFDTAVHIITVSPLPHAGIINGAASICQGATDTLTDTVSGGIWTTTNTNAIVTSVAAGGAITAINAGIDTVVYTYTNSCGTDVTTKVITIIPLPDAGIITGVDSICLGASNTLVAAITGGNWFTANNTLSIAGIGTSCGIFALKTGIDTISYVVTTGCGTDTATYTIVINPLPTVGVIFGASFGCPGDTALLFDSPANGTWTVTNTHAQITNDGVLRMITAGIDTVIYTVVNSCGTAFDLHPVTIYALPDTAKLTGTANVCIGESLRIKADVPGGTWASQSDVATVDNGVVTGVHAGIDIISYTLTTVCGVATTLKMLVVDSCYTIPADSVKKGLVHIYPSPTSDKVTIETVPGNFDQYMVIGMDGSVFVKGPILSPLVDVYFTNFAPGLYFIKLTGPFGGWSERVLKQ